MNFTKQKEELRRKMQAYLRGEISYDELYNTAIALIPENESDAQRFTQLEPELNSAIEEIIYLGETFDIDEEDTKACEQRIVELLE